MQMKKRVLSVLLALCLAGSLASTAWAAGDTAGATPSPAPVTQNLDENAGEPAELNENGEALENTDLTDETLDDATDGAPDSDSTGVPEEGDTSDEDRTPVEENASDGESDNSQSAPSNPDQTGDNGEKGEESASNDKKTDSDEAEANKNAENEKLAEDGDLNGTGPQRAPSVNNGSLNVEEDTQPAVLADDGISTYAVENDNGITVNLFDYDGPYGTYQNLGPQTINNNDRVLKFFNFTSRNPVNQGRPNDWNTSATQKIVADALGEDGYPQMAMNANGSPDNNGKSLIYLFDPDHTYTGVTGAYKNLTGLFTKNGDNYSFDSEKTNARLNNNGTAFTTDKAGKGFFPFGDTNYSFGMTVEFEFLMPLGGMIDSDTPMQFSFSGDDDVWVFIDDRLALDIGGIHGALSGTLDFSNGTALVDGKPSVDFWRNMVKEDGTPYNSFEEWQSEWVTRPHTLKFFYLERGGNASNCKINFNMPTVPTDSVLVSKQVTGKVPQGAPAAYTMQLLLEKDGQYVAPGANDNITVNDTPTSNGIFTIGANQSVRIDGIPQGTNYKIQECNVPEGLDSVTIGGEKIEEVTAGGTVVPERIFNSSNDHAVVVVNAYPLETVVTQDATVHTSKTAVENTEDPSKYTLTLTVDGQIGSATNKQPMDVLFVVDQSSSMDEDMGTYYDENGREQYDDTPRINRVREAVEKITDNLSANVGLDVQYATVTFSGDSSVNWHSGIFGFGSYYENTDKNKDSYLVTDWTTDPNSADRAQKIQDDLDDVVPSGGTNYQAGLQEAKKMLQSARTGATKVVIFLSDGNPTYYYAPSDGNYTVMNGGDAVRSTAGQTVGRGSGFDQNAQDAAEDECSSLAGLGVNYFYCIGVGPDNDSSIEQNLNSLVTATNLDEEHSNTYRGTDASELLDAFKNIEGAITNFSATNVTVYDTLSNYADFALDSTGNKQFWIEVTGPDPQNTEQTKTWSSVNGLDPLTLTFQNSEGQDIIAKVIPPEGGSKEFRLVLNPKQDGSAGDYGLEPGYTYSVKTIITPSETAKQEYAGLTGETEDAKYAGKDHAESGTGTYADQNGFYSNVNYDEDKQNGARVEFTANKAEKEQGFPKPVIRVKQLDTGDLTISKQVGGDAINTDVAGQTFNFTIKAGSNVNTNQLTEDEFTVTGAVQDTISFSENGDGSYSASLQISGTGNATIEDLPTGTYTVTESSPGNLQHFMFDSSTVLTGNATVSKDGTSTVEITNKYSRIKYNLTVNKIVGGGMGDTETEFDFTVTLTDTLRNNAAYSFPTEQIPAGLSAVQGKNGVYSFQLSNGDKVDISLPAGVTAVVAENTTEHPDYEVSSRQYETPEVGTEITETSNPFTGVDNQTVENINADYTVDFKNVRPVVAPTGLESNHTTPYTLMVTAAGIAGLALIGGIVVRRRRRRME